MKQQKNDYHGFRFHGGPEGDKNLCDLIDFSVNTNTCGPSPEVVKAIRNADFEVYPDPTGLSLREEIARVEQVNHDQVIIGNGAAELLWTLSRVIIQPTDTVLIVEPTFCEFRNACQVITHHVLGWYPEDNSGFKVDLEKLSVDIGLIKPKAVYLCNPNSPTGCYLDLYLIIGLAESHPNVTFILDEAFLSLSDHWQQTAVGVPDNVIRVRSFTKEHAIAGLRLGYMILPNQIRSAMEKTRPWWTINSLALAAGIAAIGQAQWVIDSRKKMLIDRDYMEYQLGQIGLTFLPSTTIFTMVKLGDTAKTCRSLLSSGFLIRDCESYGLTGWVRLCARPQNDVDQLIDSIKENVE